MFTDDEEDPVKIEEYSETAKTIYQTVRREFSEWKEAHKAKVFARLAHSASSRSTKHFCLPPACLEPVPRPTHGDSNAMHLYSYSADGSIIESESVPMSVYPVVDSRSFPPHAPYQYCSAASRSENARMINDKNAPFVPFPEDPTFPRSEYLSCFETCQWIDDQHDPDEEVIQYETVRRLHITHHFTAELIDKVNATQMLFRPLRLSNESGLLWDVSQRDLLNVVWGDGLPSSSNERPHLPLYFGQECPEPDDIFDQINRGLQKFCPNLNCIQHNCHVHVDYEWESKTPLLRLKQPHRTSDGLGVLAEAPCGDECFLHISEDAMEDDSADDVLLSDLSVLYGILKVEPDMLPCNLAVICRLTCRIAFVLRKQAINDEDVLEDRPDKRRRKKRRPKLDFSGQIPLLKLCNHTGPCSSASCECFKLKRYCDRNCRCQNDCVRRWPGCDSTCKRNRRCSERTKNGCKCRIEGRECDPEKCTACDARNTDTRCTNVALQRGRFKRFEVKKSQYGLGAFATETIGKDDLIGEYVGELVDDTGEGMGHRGIIHDHSKLNYCFNLNSEVCTVVDAQWLGNPTRFLNDSKPARPNCVAYEFVVNGEPRIMIKALKRIREGAELTLEYGEKYWNPHDEEEEN
ncbi:hypothetical protein B0H12DRAFT_1325805 [Mycena haematopus]|nr:hypothetical protein B0H12DRAFT_1325805 [Mycena haematopus]